jgi:sulfite exporter TauE/SafE
MDWLQAGKYVELAVVCAVMGGIGFAVPRSMDVSKGGSVIIGAMAVILGVVFCWLGLRQS